MKNIWIINHYATPPSLGGLTRHHYFAKYLARKDYNVKVIAASAIHNSNINMINNGAKYIESNIDGVCYIHINTCQYKSKIKRIKNMFQYYFRAKKYLRKFNKPDVIYTSMPQPLSALLSIKLAKKSNIPCIVETRDLWPETIISFGILSRKNPITLILSKVEKYIYTHADKLVFTMEGGIEYLKGRKYSKKINFDKVYHLNNGADLEKIKYDMSHYKLSDTDLDDNETFKIIYAGSIRYAYKIDIIVKLAKMFQDNDMNKIKFLIYGNGPYLNELKKICYNKKINNIIFKGFVDSKYIPYIMSKCDLSLLHGANHDVFKYGTSQNKMFSYLASGRPIISTFPNKYDLITRYGCGETVQTDSLEEYYDKILKIYNLSSEEYNIYCDNSKKLSENYNYKKLTDKLIDIIEEK